MREDKLGRKSSVSNGEGTVRKERVQAEGEFSAPSMAYKWEWFGVRKIERKIEIE